MKKYSKLFGAALVMSCLALTSCDSVFDDLAKNPNQQDVTSFYTTQENVNKGILGIYSYITTPRAMGASGIRLLVNRGDEESDTPTMAYQDSIVPPSTHRGILLFSHIACSIQQPRRLAR